MKTSFRLLCFCFLLLLGLPLSAKKPKAVPQRPLRVACVGNSVTYGYGLRNRDRDAYPVRLQQLLDATYGAGRFEVGNFGRSGATLLNRGHRPYMQQPEFRQAMDFKADWVVIHLGLNDTDPRDWPDWKEDFIPDYRALPCTRAPTSSPMPCIPIPRAHRSWPARSMEPSPATTAGCACRPSIPAVWSFLATSTC